MGAWKAAVWPIKGKISKGICVFYGHTRWVVLLSHPFPGTQKGGGISSLFSKIVRLRISSALSPDSDGVLSTTLCF